jgi:hypothetical protein
MDPNVRRLGLLPYPKGALGEGPVNWTDWVAPEWLHSFAKGAVTPGHALKGGHWTPDEVTRDVGLNVAGMGYAAGGLLAPKGAALGMGATRPGIGHNLGPAMDEIGPVYQSRLKPAIEAMPMEKMTAEQAAGHFRKYPGGVSADELEWSGVQGLLGAGGTVTKSGLLQQYEENPLVIEDVTKTTEADAGEGLPAELGFDFTDREYIADPDYVSAQAEDFVYDIEQHTSDSMYLDEALDQMQTNLSGKHQVHRYGPDWRQKITEAISEGGVAQIGKTLDDFAENEFREAIEDISQRMYDDDPVYRFQDEQGLGYDITGNDSIGYQIADPEGNSISGIDNDPIYSLVEAEIQAQTHAMDEGLVGIGNRQDTTRWSDYVLPGGTNYREVVMTLPPRHKETMSWEVRPSNIEGEWAVYENLPYAGKSTQLHSFVNKADAEQAVKFSEAALARGDIKAPEHASFVSPHWAEKNPVAHARMATHKIDGDRTLLVEEVQSDWHKAGWEKGYHQPRELEKLNDELVVANDEWIKTVNKILYSKSGDDAYAAVGDMSYGEIASASRQNAWKEGIFTPEERALLNEKAMNVDRLVEAKKGMSSDIPDAPFKKNWPELTLKRMIREAADTDHTRIAWTSGQTQADRYNLRKEISEIHYSGTNFKTYDHNGNVSIERTGVEESDLPGLIGKEAADRLLAQKPEGTLRSLVDEELEVGGEFHKKLYDKTLVKAANKFAKKYDQEVEVKEIDTGPEVYSITNKITGNSIGGGYSKANAKAKVASEPDKYEMILKTGGPQEVWSLKITPEMRRDILKGGVALSGAGLLYSPKERQSQ